MRDPTKVTIGAGSRLAGTVYLDSWAPITIGANVLINSARFSTARHDIDSSVMSDIIEPITVGDHAWIIHQVIVLPGISIGGRAVVGTGSVVTKDVEPSAVVVGNPARKIRKRADVQLEYVPAGFG
jgi:maltose O-acetyltransferase